MERAVLARSIDDGVTRRYMLLLSGKANFAIARFF